MSTESKNGNEIARRWNIPQSLLDKCVKELELSLERGSTRDKQATATVLSSMLGANLKRDEFDDKTARLDAGLPTEISDQATLGTAVADFADRLRSILGHGAGEDTRTVKVVGGGEAEVQGLPSGAEPSNADP